MRTFIACCVFILSGFKASSQTERKIPFNFKSTILHLSVTADGGMVLTSRVGETAVYNPVSKYWFKAAINDKNDITGPTVDQSNFFNKDTGFISGFIDDEEGNYNLIYYTNNGGHSWKQINFGQNGWVDKTVNLNNGEAWLSVAGSGLAYTKDFGLHWEKIKIPEIKQRFTEIFFNPSHSGIIGSLWNYLACTEDNGRSWKQLPTPLDQQQYRKTNADNRPQFNNVAIWGNYFLVKQEELVFFSRRDSIHWQWLKQYDDFYTDPYNTALYFQKGNTIIKADTALAPLSAHKLTETGFHYTCRNGKLTWVSSTGIGQLLPDNTIVMLPFETSEGPVPQPVIIGYTSKAIFGADGTSIFTKKDYEAEWQADITLPLPFTPVRVVLTEDERFLACSPGDSLYYLNRRGKLLSVITLKEWLNNFTAPGITQLTISDGSNGCFHGYRNKAVYQEDGDDYVRKETDNKGDGNNKSLTGGPAVIDAAELSKLLVQLPALFNKDSLPAVQDLGFTEKDFTQCRKNIREFEQAIATGKKKKTAFYMWQNNIDFERLLSLLDTIKSLDKKRLNVYLSNLTEMWSTTSYTKSIELKNKEGRLLAISSRFYSSNAFYVPWTITLDGYSVSTTHLAVYWFLKRTWPAFLEDDNKVDVLHILLRRLY